MFEDWFDDSFGNDYVPEDFGSALDSIGTSSLYSTGLDGLDYSSLLDGATGGLDLSNLLGADTGLDLSSILGQNGASLGDELSGLQTSDIDSALQYTPAQQTALDDLIAKYAAPEATSAADPVTSDLIDSWRLSNPTGEMLTSTAADTSAAMDNPVTRSMLVNSYLSSNPGVLDTGPEATTSAGAYNVQNPGVYGVSPDTGGSYDNKQSVWNWLQSPAAGNESSQASQAALYKALGLAAPAAKTNLQMGLQGALAAAQIYGALRGSKTKANTATAPSLSYSSAGIQNPGAVGMTWNSSKLKRADGGSIPGQAMPRARRGALGLLRGASAGQEDNVPIDASHGEYVFDADTVSALGDGNTEAGARKLDQMRKAIRTHKRSAPSTQIPPKAKPVGAYLKGTK